MTRTLIQALAISLARRALVAPENVSQGDSRGLRDPGDIFIYPFEIANDRTTWTPLTILVRNFSDHCIQFPRVSQFGQPTKNRETGKLGMSQAFLFVETCYSVRDLTGPGLIQGPQNCSIFVIIFLSRFPGTGEKLEPMKTRKIFAGNSEYLKCKNWM